MARARGGHATSIQNLVVAVYPTHDPAVLAAEITARMGRDPGEIYHELTREFGAPVYDRVEASATPDQIKRNCWRNSYQQVKLNELASEKIHRVLTHAPGNGEPIGGLKVLAESGWFAASWRKRKRLSAMHYRRCWCRSGA